MTSIERLQGTLGALGLTALEARLEGLLEHASKSEQSEEAAAERPDRGGGNREHAVIP